MKFTLDTVKTIVTLTPVALDLIAEISKLSNSQSNMPRYLNTISEIIRHGDEAIGELEKFTDFMEAMVKENREPTESEWKALRTRADIAFDQVQNVRLGDDENNG